MKRLLLLTLRSGIFLSAILLLWVNGILYLAPANEPDFESLPPHAIAHLAGLREALGDGAGTDMQALFPEGYFFCHELYGLAWVEVGLRSHEYRTDAIREARWALTHLESPHGKSAFPASLPPGHGMFYAGWRNALQAGIALLSDDTAEIVMLRQRCDDLEIALKESPAWPWLASYHNQVWPCDAPPGIHAMRIYDHVSGEQRYASFIQTWVDVVKQTLDPTYGMITHFVTPSSGQPLETPRGTSQTIILRFLADIDPDFAADQYERFQTHFHDTLLQVPAVREYPKGVNGIGDVDSGPLIAGISGSATVVGMGVAQIYGDEALARAISQTGEAIGFPFGSEKRTYLGGMLPVGDAFVVHATTARPWLIPDHHRIAITPTPVSRFWRWGIHLVSLLSGAGFLLLWRTTSVR